VLAVLLWVVVIVACTERTALLFRVCTFAYEGEGLYAEGLCAQALTSY